MAKLNGVKTVDMVNGEITKVAYEGAEYAKVDGIVQKGDIAVVVEPWGSQKAGEFYFVEKAEYDYKDHGRNYVTIVKGNPDEYCAYDTDMKYFRKISTQSEPTLEQVAKRVETLESDVAVLKGEKVTEVPRRLTVGDVAKIIGYESHHFGEIGDIVKIKIDEEDRQPYKCERISDGKDVGWFYEEDLEEYNEETIEFEGATYRKVDREAREGDVVILTGDELPRWFTKGKAYKIGKGPYIEKCDGGYANYAVYDFSYGRTRETVDVYEPIEQAKYVPQDGDIVVIVKSEHGSRNSVGDIGKVSDVSPVNFAVDVPQKPKAPRANGNKHVAYEVRKATPAEVEKYEQAMKDVEIASKWAKIGRKPKELRKGDIVRIINACGAPLSNGDLIEVISDSHEDSAHVKGGWTVRSKLIATVESTHK